MANDSECEETTRTVSAAEFQERCIELIDEILDDGGDVVITQDGRPMARLITYRRGRPAGSGKGMFKITGDVVSPVSADWLDESDTPAVSSS